MGSGQLPRAPNPEPRAKVGTERSNCLTLSQQGGWVAAGDKTIAHAIVELRQWRLFFPPQRHRNGGSSHVVAVIALLAAIAIPNVLRGRTTANESAAIGNIRALVSSLEMFRSVNNTYPADDLWIRMYDAATSVCGGTTLPNPDFGPPSFCLALTGGAADLVQGFIYDYDSVAAGTYTLVAWADQLGVTGTRSFFANETGLIRHCTMTAATSRATTASPTIDAPVANCP